MSTRRLSVGAPLFNQCPMPWAGRAGTRATISMHLRRDGSWPTARHRLFHRNRTELPSTRARTDSARLPRWPAPGVRDVRRRSPAGLSNLFFLSAASRASLSPHSCVSRSGADLSSRSRMADRPASRWSGSKKPPAGRPGWTRSLCGASATPLAPEHAGCHRFKNALERCTDVAPTTSS